MQSGKPGSPSTRETAATALMAVTSAQLANTEAPMANAQISLPEDLPQVRPFRESLQDRHLLMQKRWLLLAVCQKVSTSLDRIEPMTKAAAGWMCLLNVRVLERLCPECDLHSSPSQDSEILPLYSSLLLAPSTWVKLALVPRLSLPTIPSPHNLYKHLLQ